MIYFLPLLFYFACLIIIGEISARKKIKNLDDFLLAGRKHGLFITSGSLAATVIGAGSTIGAAGAAYYVGISAAWYLLSACVGLFILGFTLVPALREMSLYTIPEFIGKRYGERAGYLASFLSMIALILFLAAQFYALGAIFQQLTGISLKLATLIGATLVIFYTLRGGAWAVHLSDNFQLFVIILGMFFLCLLGLKYVEGFKTFYSPPLAMGFEELGKKWFHPLEKSAVNPGDIFGLRGTILGWIIMSTTWHLTMQSTAQRFLSAKDANTARKSCLASALILIPISLSIALAGMIARILCPDLPPAEGLSQGNALPALITEILPPLLGGLLLAALIATIMSTCDSTLLGASSILLKDLHINLNIRILILIVGTIGMVLAIVFPRLIQLLEWTAAIYCVSVSAPLISGIYWSGATEKGAVATMVLTGIASGAWRLSGIESMTGIHFLIPALVFSFMIMFILNSFTITKKPHCPSKTRK
jgi:SSS family solute:Na+ symporter